MRDDSKKVPGCSGWLCNERWRLIYVMQYFHHKMTDEDNIRNLNNNGNILSFARGDRGFFALYTGGTPGYKPNKITFDTGTVYI